ncbi:hypothetical protein [Streptomyces sp. NPDC004284]|uniref:hypothetical protein n=1 Tax=Streptomyces sp. NPDC004284 TaxID=3364695 RepID=UPI00369AEC03
MATLKSWRLLRKPRCSIHRITDIVKAILFLHHTSSWGLEKAPCITRHRTQRPVTADGDARAA